MKLTIDALQATPGGGLSANRLSAHKGVTVGGLALRAPLIVERERIAPDMVLDVTPDAPGAWRLLCYSRHWTDTGSHPCAGHSPNSVEGSATGDASGGLILVSVAAPGLTVVDAQMTYSPDVTLMLVNSGARSIEFHFRTLTADPFQVVIGWALSGAWVQPDGTGRVFGVRLDPIQ